MLTIGFKQTVVAFRECMRLKQTFLYLVFYFLMCVSRLSPLLIDDAVTNLDILLFRGDVLNTTV